MGRLFGTDGVRGIANEFLGADLALSIGRAAGTVVGGRHRRRRVFCVGYDTRMSSEMLCCAVAAGICSSGADVIILGVVPTPAVAYLVGKYKCDAGIMISASHNSAEFNGIKIFNGDGYKIPDALEEKIENLILNREFFASAPLDVGRIEYALNAAGDYAEYVKNTVSHSLDGMKLALDCANGSAAKTAEMLFTTLGAQVELISAQPDGANINRDCGSTDIHRLCEYIKNGNFDGGAAFDGDADRCICVDENGHVFDGDDIMAVCALDMKNRGRLAKNTVVGTVMTNFGFGKFCSRNNINFITTKVGDRYVLEEMLIGEYNLGGEQSGHVIFRDYSTTGDGQLTAAQFFSIVARSGEPPSSFGGMLKKYPQINVSVKVNEEEKLAFYTDEKIKEAVDGAKDLLGESGRVVVRASGTEPLIRIMAEGEDETIISKIADDIKNVIVNSLSPGE